MKLNLRVLDNKKVAIAVFLVVTLLFLMPIFSNFSYWGGHDWDQHMFYHGSARVSVLKFHQFPMWNPFYCGGNVMLANPQSTFLGPGFLFVLLFGTVAGLKLEIIAYTIVGMLGMWLLAKKLGAKGLSAYLAPVIFMLSSWYALHIQAGHTTFFPFALMPFTLLYYLKALKKRKFAVLAALILVVMLFSGGIYPFYFSALLLGIYSLFDAIGTKKAKPLVVLLMIFVFALLFAAIKLIPMIEAVSDMPSIKDEQLNSFSMLYNALFSRTQSTELNIDQEKMFSGEIPWGGHEYGAYIGVLPAVLLLLSFVNYRKNWKLIILALFFLLLSLGSASPINVWGVMQKLPLVGSLHGPSRFIILFVFCAALLASKAASDMKIPRKSIVLIALLAVIIVNLILVSRPLLQETFTVEPVEQEKNTYGYDNYIHVFTNAPYNAQYLYMLYNFDTVNCYERLHPEIKAVPQFLDEEIGEKQYSEFIGNAYLAETNQSFELSYFSPNVVKVEVVNITEPRTLVLNQNYLSGWKVKNKEAFHYNGLIATEVIEDGEVIFYYLPKTFIIGIVMSIIGLGLVGLMFVRKK